MNCTDKLNRFLEEVEKEFDYSEKETLPELREICRGEKARFPGPDGFFMTRIAEELGILKPKEAPNGEARLTTFGRQYESASEEMHETILAARITKDGSVI